MIPKILGIGAAGLAVAFILALPSVFEPEPANEVEPIRFGPRPVMELARAMRVEEPPPRRPEPSLPQLTPAPLSSPPPPAPVAAPSEEVTGEAAGTEFVEPPPEQSGGDDGGDDDDGEDEGDD